MGRSHLLNKNVFTSTHSISLQHATPPYSQIQLRRIQSILQTFIWNAMNPRLKKKILHIPVNMARMGAPNVISYYKATVLFPIQALVVPSPEVTLDPN